MQQPIFVDTVTQIPADFMNLVADIVFGPLNQATTVPGVLAALGIGTLAAQNVGAVAITGGTLDGVAIGNTTQATGKFSVLFNYGTPTNPQHAANKAYVDSQISGAGLNPSYVALNYLALAGGTLTGPLVLASNPTTALQAATKQYVDTVAAGFVTQATLNEALGTVPSSNYVNALIAQQAAREFYHDSFTMNGTSNILTLRTTPAGDVTVFVNGAPIPRSQVSNGAANTAVLTFNPIGAVEALYYGATGTGTAVTGLLMLTGGTMTGPLILSGDPTTGLQAATKEYVDSKASSGYTIGGGLTLTGDVLAANLLTVAGRTGNVTLTPADVVGLATVASSGSYSDLINKPTIPSQYTLTPASTSALGGVIIGAGLSVTTGGVLSATATGVTPATTSTIGGIIVGANLTVNGSGLLSIVPSTALNICSNAAEGLVAVNEMWAASAWVNLGNVAGAVTINGALGFRFYATMTANCTINFTNVLNGQPIEVALYQDATGGHTVAWDSRVHWVGSAPTVVTTANANAVLATVEGSWSPSTLLIGSGAALT